MELTELPMTGAASLDGAGSEDEAAPSSRLRGFHPGWFGAVMGTAIVAIAAMQNPGAVTSLAPAARSLAQVMSAIAAVLGAALLVAYLGRFLLHHDAALADLRDPVAGALYGTLPGGILVLAAAAADIGSTWFSPETVRGIVIWLDWVGVPLAFATSIVFAYLLFVRSEVVLESVNGGWFIPPVVNIVVPLVLIPLVPGSSPMLARALLLTSYGFWGMGFLLYLLIVTMLHHRLVLHPLPHAGLAPSLWIGLGPIGAGALALLKMAAAGGGAFGPGAASLELASKLAATAMWGFGAWWLVAAALLLVHYLRAGRLPYGIGWWGFTFPLGAYTVATLSLGKAWQLRGLEVAGGVLFVLLGIFWLVVTGRTAVALGSGEALRAERATVPTDRDSGGNLSAIGQRPADQPAYPPPTDHLVGTVRLGAG
ncbi:MAG: hypothetical protein M0Z69_16530 [Actinomycetota bacterium]|nr:hypothetical protein [Actinomycetota bacterium]